MSATADQDVERARDKIASAEGVLVLTGAGISAQSGVPTFRGPEGLWRRERIAPLRPNAAHDALAVLEARVDDFLLATQNVDGLHAVAGSRQLAKIHGSLWRVRCVACGERREDRRVPLPEPRLVAGTA